MKSYSGRQIIRDMKIKTMRRLMSKETHKDQYQKHLHSGNAGVGLRKQETFMMLVGCSW